MFYLDNAKIEYHKSITKGEDVRFVINNQVIDYLKEFDFFNKINIKSIIDESIIVNKKDLKNGEYFSILKNENAINYL
ncbi:hypothetical protein LGK95_21655 [Clostridium algoriphilum]|uniref:hypothetical protein n=1 Tax=Clostridium algoriphilum TaxID=198347 RepID=UPI001CF554A6|nr:hypothetical protein [Clostridium algoriphilum]MCB2296059.1 hypothetical protein [Clostridium algoriphilum]